MPIRTMLFRFIFLLLCMPAFAQEQATDVLVRATVLNSAGRILPSEEVHFVRKDNGVTYKARSDAQGRFELRLPAGSPYQVRIRTLTDTTNYTEFETPQPRRDGYALRTLSIEIEFDPPRLYTLPDVLFATGTYALKPALLPSLDAMSEYMQLHPGDRYAITGYTDNTGSSSANKQLSEKRAEVVRNYLVKKGVPPARLSAAGLGSEKPVAANDTPEGRRKNRRTEIAVL